MKTKSHLKLRALCEGAIMVALAYVLSFIKLFELPQGGSIDIGMLPIFLYCARWGFGPGLLASFVYSFLQLLQGGGFVIGWQSILGDYIVAYTLLGLAGLFHKNPYGYFYGVLVGGLARFLSHYITGATLWAEYMPDTFFGMTMTSPWLLRALQRQLHARRHDRVRSRRLGAVEAPRQVHPRRRSAEISPLSVSLM